jgi:cytochrome P450
MTAWRALRARGHIARAFSSYFDKDGHAKACPMVSEMYSKHRSLGLSVSEAAKIEIATSLAILSSSAITAFWLLFEIFSDTSILEAIRNELSTLSKGELDNDTLPKRKLVDLKDIRACCPTLVATLNETLRYYSTVINIKQVRHDTMLNGQYLLKKDAIIVVSGRSIHYDTSIWGPSAQRFDIGRFLDVNRNKTVLSTSTFRPFGDGASMCPGRIFSTNVILSLAAMIVLQYDLVPDKDEWRAPTTTNSDMWNSMPKPDADVSVSLLRRRGEEELAWDYTWGNREGEANCSLRSKRFSGMLFT